MCQISTVTPQVSEKDFITPSPPPARTCCFGLQLMEDASYQTQLIHWGFALLKDTLLWPTLIKFYTSQASYAPHIFVRHTTTRGSIQRLVISSTQIYHFSVKVVTGKITAKSITELAAPLDLLRWLPQVSVLRCCERAENCS